MSAKMEPKEYRRILEGIELENLILKESKTEINHELISENMAVSSKDNATYIITKDGFAVENKHTVIVKNKDKKNVIRIEGTFLILFNSREAITDAFFDIYKNISLPLNVWPFFREFVNSMTARMNIPPLTLPLLKR